MLLLVNNINIISIIFTYECDMLQTIKQFIIKKFIGIGDVNLIKKFLQIFQ